MNLCIAYELDKWSQDLNVEFTLKYCLLGVVMLSKNAHPDKYSYSGYGTGFDSRSLFSYPCFNWGKNVITFWVNNSSLVYIDRKEKDILALFEGLTQGLDGTTTKAEAIYPIDNSRLQRKFCLSLQYKGSNSFFL